MFGSGKRAIFAASAGVWALAMLLPLAWADCPQGQLGAVPLLMGPRSDRLAKDVSVLVTRMHLIPPKYIDRGAQEAVQPEDRAKLGEIGSASALDLPGLDAHLAGASAHGMGQGVVQLPNLDVNGLAFWTDQGGGVVTSGHQDFAPVIANPGGKTPVTFQAGLGLFLVGTPKEILAGQSPVDIATVSPEAGVGVSHQDILGGRLHFKVIGGPDFTVLGGSPGRVSGQTWGLLEGEF